MDGVQFYESRCIRTVTCKHALPNSRTPVLILELDQIRLSNSLEYRHKNGVMHPIV